MIGAIVHADEAADVMQELPSLGVTADTSDGPVTKDSADCSNIMCRQGPRRIKPGYVRVGKTDAS